MKDQLYRAVILALGLESAFQPTKDLYTYPDFWLYWISTTLLNV